MARWLAALVAALMIAGFTAQAASAATTSPVPQVSVGGPGGAGHRPESRARRAIAFARHQIGCPYVWGGTGPCRDGFDCSGLVMMAWAHAGVRIPRTSEEQWAELRHVPLSRLRPGDLLIFLGGDHVALYVGHNKLIEAPHTGATVHLAEFSGWYRQNFDGAVKP